MTGHRPAVHTLAPLLALLLAAPSGALSAAGSLDLAIAGRRAEMAARKHRPAPAGTVQAAADDAFEPDNTPAEAKDIVVDGEVQARSLGAPGDSDWARFTLAVPTQVTIETTGVPGGDTLVFLFRGDDGTVEQNDLVDADDDGGSFFYSRLTSEVLAAGTYYVLVTPFNRVGTLSSYTLSVRSGLPAPPAADAFEPDDTARQARPIQVNGDTQIHSMHTAEDRDFVRFRMRRLGRVFIVVGYAGDELAQTQLRLLRNGREVATGFGFIQQLLPAGNYTVEVRSNSPLGVIEAYGLSVFTF
jgi:hypothetical protein